MFEPRTTERIGTSPMTGEELFAQFIAWDITAREIAPLTLAVMEQRIDKLRQEAPRPDSVALTNRQVAVRILLFARGGR